MENEPGIPPMVEPASEPSEERKFTQSELDAIIERRLAKERNKLSQERDEQDQEAIKEAEKTGFALGQFAARRQQVADQYALDADLLPDTEEKLAEFEKQLNVTITNRRRVLPVEVQSTSAAPNWIGAIHV